MNKTLKRVALLILSALLLGAMGCDAAGYSLWLLTPREERKVKAAYPGLRGHGVAVVIYAPQKVLFDYPDVRLSLGAKIAALLEQNVKDLHTIPATTVSRYQDENPHWATQSMRRVGRDLKSDFVLLVSLEEYTMRQPGHMNSYQGQIMGISRLYSLLPGDGEEPVWQSEEPIEVVYPKVARYSPEYLPKIRHNTESLFADQLAKKFYDHKVKVDIDEEKP